MARYNQPIFLHVWLEDGRTDKFVKAIVRDVSGVEVSGSPAMLSHIGEGLYTNSTDVIYPVGTTSVTATYEVFEDVLLTMRSFDYYIDGDVYYLDYDIKIEDDLLKIFNDLEILISSIHTDLIGEIDDMTCLIGEVSEDIIVGEVIDGSDLVGEIDDDVVVGEIEDCP